MRSYNSNVKRLEITGKGCKDFIFITLELSLHKTVETSLGWILWRNLGDRWNRSASRFAAVMIIM